MKRPRPRVRADLERVLVPVGASASHSLPLYIRQQYETVSHPSVAHVRYAPLLRVGTSASAAQESPTRRDMRRADDPSMAVLEAALTEHAGALAQTDAFIARERMHLEALRGAVPSALALPPISRDQSSPREPPIDAALFQRLDPPLAAAGTIHANAAAADGSTPAAAAAAAV
eukprot:TRINITY_DN1918_c0_g1_i1.p1 TRINITY_DN1918_c0_g1~~TRINITY_DN1918_c0_g1_i1.p1  ORF type:complete len:173 (-),score=13.42 TRINITY_DN1918_c0_g1_i1:117-635(-)